jgi:hypothetical protein
VDRYLLGNPVRLSNTVRQRNADGTLTLVNPTTAVYTVLRPDGTTQTYSSPTSDGTGLLHQDLSDTADVTQLGVYQWKLKTTGAGAGTATGSFQIVESFALPDLEVWRPSRVQVAKYVPERTVAADQLSDFPLNDFTAATTPTADQADMHIDDAASWVALRVGTLDPSLYLDASAIVAIRAAGMIELSFPVRDADINTGQALLAQADAMVERLVIANEGASPGTSAPGLLSAWAFPDPVPWGDRLDLW